MIPDDRKYTESHEWVKIEGDLAVVGITDHAQEALGDITFVELPASDEYVHQGDETAVIESVKAASDIYAPISGNVREINSDLEDSPDLINSDPYDQGWIFKLKGFDEEQFENLMDSAQYEACQDSSA